MVAPAKGQLRTGHWHSRQRDGLSPIPTVYRQRPEQRAQAVVVFRQGSRFILKTCKLPKKDAAVSWPRQVLHLQVEIVFALLNLVRVGANRVYIQRDHELLQWLRGGCHVT